MVMGRLSVYWENSPAPPELRVYRVNFAEYNGESGAQTPRMLERTETLRGFLISVQSQTMKTESPENRTNEWLRELHGKGTFALDHVELTEDQADSFRRM
jgi:hypothetical protein